MASQEEVGLCLEECLRLSALRPSCPTEENTLKFCRCRDSLCAELACLLQEAEEMKWPFVPEKWQYKQSLSSQDKTNLTDLISQHLPQLLTLLKVSILAQEAPSALAVIFLVDRFLYWTDESGRLLKITRQLHRAYPDAPVAPQLVVRQARVYLNSGKLQKAEYILSSLINNSGATGCWVYHNEHDRVLIQAVSVQVRGLVLQKLGLWLEAAELIWASLVGYYALPKPDKKGIGTSLGVLANILVSMNDDDFHAFKTNPDIDLSFLGDHSHRLLFAAEAAKMAVVYSQYTSLFVLTNVVSQGTCLLSYSFSLECLSSERQAFLKEAREAFEIGLHTKSEGELVTSKQELHTFLKAAYSLTVAHKWLGTTTDTLQKATQACQGALAHFYDYCDANTQERDNLCVKIMRLVTAVKTVLKVEPFPNSDKGSFIPDSYRDVKEKASVFTPETFAKVLGKFRRYLASVCQANSTNCRNEPRGRTARLCITALGTTVGTLDTECTTKSQEVAIANSPALHHPVMSEICTTQDSVSDLGSSWQNFSLSHSGSPRPSRGYTGSGDCAKENKENACDSSCMTTNDSGDNSNGVNGSFDKNRKQNEDGHIAGVCTQAEPWTSKHMTSTAGSCGKQFEVKQSDMETADSEDWIDVSGSLKTSSTNGVTQSMSQLAHKTPSVSLSDSFGSKSSWEKLSLSPVASSPLPMAQLRPGGRHQSFSLLEIDDCETDCETADPECFSGAVCRREQLKSTSRPQPLRSYDVDPNADTETEPPPGGLEDATGDLCTPPQHSNSRPYISQSAPTKTSSESSFEILEEREMSCPGPLPNSTKQPNTPCRKNSSCYSCQKCSIVDSVVPRRQYTLTKNDYNALLAGVCRDCILKRLQSETKFKLRNYRIAYNALHVKFSRATGLWTARETCAYIGKSMEMEGKQRTTIWVQFLHQEERLSSYVAKDYLEPQVIEMHLKDVERQMTAQYYVTEFNKSLYDKEVTAQIFFIPSEVLLLLEGDEIVGCVTVEPHMLGDFKKLTNNTHKKDQTLQATEYGIAFGHFTYLFSDSQEVVVDLQGWVTANGKGLTYLTDPQIHSLRVPKGQHNFADRGLRFFVENQHGPQCNAICNLLKLPPMGSVKLQI